MFIHIQTNVSTYPNTIALIVNSQVVTCITCTKLLAAFKQPIWISVTSFTKDVI